MQGAKGIGVARRSRCLLPRALRVVFPPPCFCSSSLVNQQQQQQQPRFAASCAPADEGMALRVRGVIDTLTIPEFRDAVFTAMGERPCLLLLDLTQVEAVDTTGLDTLVTIARVARTVNLNLSILPSPRLLRVLTMTGMAGALPLLPSTRSAAGSVAEDAAKKAAPPEEK